MITNNMSIADGAKFPVVVDAQGVMGVGDVKVDDTKQEEVKLDQLTEALKSNKIDAFKDTDKDHDL